MMDTATTAPTCGSCGFSDVLAVTMRMEDGDVVFHVCLRCEERAWEKNGSPATRDRALAAIPRR